MGPLFMDRKNISVICNLLRRAAFRRQQSNLSKMIACLISDFQALCEFNEAHFLMFFPAAATADRRLYE